MSESDETRNKQKDKKLQGSDLAKKKRFIYNLTDCQTASVSGPASSFIVQISAITLVSTVLS